MTQHFCQSLKWLSYFRLKWFLLMSANVTFPLKCFKSTNVSQSIFFIKERKAKIKRTFLVNLSESEADRFSVRSSFFSRTPQVPFLHRQDRLADPDSFQQQQINPPASPGRDHGLQTPPGNKNVLLKWRFYIKIKTLNKISEDLAEL